jgi:UDP-2,4-diacetamido-2,4,6-trideoxy-beta-L-altropyranose hydrolase
MMLSSQSGNNLLIRTDGDLDLGTGHIKRCISLGKYIKRKGFNPIFLLRYGSDEARYLIQKNSFFYYEIPNFVDWFSEYEFILKSTSVSFMGILFDFSHRKTTKVNHIFPKYFKQWSSLPSCVIDGFMGECLTGNYSLSIDLAVLPYAGSEDQRHVTSCKYLMGAKYFCLDSSYYSYLSQKKVIKRKVENILITSGGNDSKGLTLKTVKAINKIKDQSFHVTIVFGSMVSNQTKEMVRFVTKQGRHNYILIDELNSLAEKIFAADLVVSASGLTKYECAAIGTPALLISINKEHASFNRPFENAGSSKHCGVITQLSVTKLSEEISLLVKSHFDRLKMSNNGAKLANGMGVEYISNYFLKIINNKGSTYV